jgi:ABC-type transporter Mla subunit MlaD
VAESKYKISGEHDPKGVNDAKKGLESLGGAVKSLNTLLKAFAGAAIFGKLKSVIADTTEEFNKNQTALNRLASGVASNAKLAEGAFDRLSRKMDKMEKATMFGADELANQAAFLSGMNLTEAAIEKTLNAAVELSHAGIGSLEDNVRKLSETFSGNVSRLGKLIPEFQTLTKEELKAGMAVDVVNSKFAGFAEAWSGGTTEGTAKRFSEAIGDIKESVGAIFSSVQDAGMNILMPVLEGLADWFSEQGPGIAARMAAGMKVVEAIVQNIANNLPKLLTPETWKNFFDKAKTMASAFVSFFRNILIDAFSFAVKALQWHFDNFSVQNFFDNLLSGFGIIYDIMKVVGKISDALNIPLKIKEFLDRGKPDNNKPAEFPRFEMSEDAKEAQEEMARAFKDTAVSLIDTLAGQDTAELFAAELEKALLKFSHDRGERRQNPVLTGSKDPDGENAAENAAEKAAKTFAEKLFETFTSSLGQAGTAVKDAVSSFKDGNIVLDGVTSAVNALAAASQNFSAVLNFMDTVFTETAALIGPLMDELFAPFVSFLQQIGRILGNLIAGVLEPLIQILEPVFLLISMIFTVLEAAAPAVGALIKVILTLVDLALTPFMWIIEQLADVFLFVYNWVLRPLLWFVHSAIAAIYNAIVLVVNSIASALNWIPGVNLGKMQYIDFLNFEDMYVDKSAMEGENEANGGTYANHSSASGTASYTAARDIFVFISYNNSYVNGDERQIALNLRDEIRKAERLGQ